MKVAVIDIDDVYDEFNFGITHPQAVRNLVDHAWHDWPQPTPRFLLLVGDASFDIRHDTYNDLAYAKFANSPQELQPGAFSGIPATRYDKVSTHTGSRNLIPTWQYPSAEGQSASDNWFGAVDGDDYHPVVAVGRFPVVEPAEVSAIVDKTIDYLTRPDPGIWRRDVMFITDESDYFKKVIRPDRQQHRQKGIQRRQDLRQPRRSRQSGPPERDQGRPQCRPVAGPFHRPWRSFHLAHRAARPAQEPRPVHPRRRQRTEERRTPADGPVDDLLFGAVRQSDRGLDRRALPARSRQGCRRRICGFLAQLAFDQASAKSLVKELLVPGATIGEGIVRSKKSIDDRTLVEMYNLLGDPAIVLERPRAGCAPRSRLGPVEPGGAGLPAWTRLPRSGRAWTGWTRRMQLLTTTVHRADETSFQRGHPEIFRRQGRPLCAPVRQ